MTKYLITVPIQDKSEKSVAKVIFEHFILTYDRIKIFILGTKYKSAILTELCNLLRIEKITSTA